MKRRELIRRGVFAGAVAALRPALGNAQGAQSAASATPPEVTPAGSGVDASKDLAGSGWKPLFLDEHQNETLIVLSDLMIPSTGTPGAKEALVNRYIDLVLAAEPHESQRMFLNSLAFLDGESIRDGRRAEIREDLAAVAEARVDAAVLAVAAEGEGAAMAGDD